MTILIGLKHNGTTILISDTRVSFGKTPKHMDFSLKSGLLFPSCLYAGTGDVKDIRIFVRKLKSHLTSRKWRPFIWYWKRFHQFSATYNFPLAADRQFKLILASRADEESKLFVLDSGTGEIKEQPDIIMLGAGADLLEDPLKEYWAINRPSLEEEFKKFPPFVLGYALCHLLMTLAQGDYSESLARYGVGGVFHFVYQTADNENRQGPAVYDIVLVSEQKKIIAHILFRVTFEKMAMIVEHGPTKSF